MGGFSFVFCFPVFDFLFWPYESIEGKMGRLAGHLKEGASGSSEERQGQIQDHPRDEHVHQRLRE